MSVAQPLRISYIELRSAKDIESIEVLFLGCRRSIQRQDKNHFREEFPESLTVQGEALSFLVRWKKWYSFYKPSVNNIQIRVRDVLPDSRSHKFQTERSKLDITIGLSSDPPPADVVPTQGKSTPSSNDSLRPTTEALLDQCPRFRILVIGQSGVGKSTLIQRAFGIEKASAENLKPGRALIEEELISPQNNRFVLHDSNGFEPADNANCDAVKSFIIDRKKREHVKDQLHAVWLCFRIPIPGHGERLLEDGAETFLKEDTSVLQNIPTIVVFTKYDKLLTHMLMEKETDPEAAAEQYLRKHCYAPIEEFARGADLSYVAVSSFATPGLDERRKRLIDLTHKKVTERFKLQVDTPSPVSVVTLMAQRISPQLKIQGSIDVGRQRYWTTLTSGANFVDHTITDCLAVIHTDIVCVWNFNDPLQYLYSDEFRGLMANLAGTIDGSTPESPRLSRIDSTSSIFKTGPPLVLLAPLILPFEAGLGLVHWARQTYHKLPDVHRKFMAYIVDLVHVLEILFSLTASNSGKKLTRGAVSSAFNAYYDSEMRYNVHRQIKSFDYKIPGRDTVLEEIISLVGMSPIDDNDISSAFQRIPLESLEKDDEWFTIPSSQKV
ncbi:hypothetical protein PISMIDRAFT_222223 [Pisolithus microcarpus 441]|uniref:Unplaced genomic scaffold scaffold_140, whole genome shotgun sequence n=1 Tax=Pisolithus microcarpus 441 TaxID=765257 RepID=A0A0C9XYK9_9AGAM|nr:hypothetical protein PISMIDRAFT_222223 [Pisolithus microcarpus 441]